MSDPWAFGWTQLLTISGFVITILIAIGGFKSFVRWKREKLEEKKIDVAFEALSLAYEAKYIFEYIEGAGFYASGGNDWRKRIDESRDFFDRVWRVQPKCMAFFGSEAEEAFRVMHVALAHFRSRRNFEDAHPGGHSVDVEGGFASARPKVFDEIDDFRKRIENVCRPIIDRNFRSVVLPPPKRAGRKGGFRLVLGRPPPLSARGTEKSP